MSIASDMIFKIFFVPAEGCSILEMGQQTLTKVQKSNLILAVGYLIASDTGTFVQFCNW